MLTSGTIKIAHGLQNILCLKEFNISNNDIGSEAAGNIATVLSQSTMLQKLFIDGNMLQTSGTITILLKVCKPLQLLMNLQFPATILVVKQQVILQLFCPTIQNFRSLRLRKIIWKHQVLVRLQKNWKNFFIVKTGCFRKQHL